MVMRKYKLLLPPIGAALYAMLYLIAAFLYPGGSMFDKTSRGFSWTQNFWCNLLYEKAINGQSNPAQPFAMTALAILAATMVTFWYQFPQQVNFKTRDRVIVQLSGFLSMAVSIFIFTGLHDYVINIGGFFGLIALAGTYVGLYKLRLMKLFWMGMFGVLLIALNNILYYGNGLIIYLPVVQKISFAYFLAWISAINILLYKRKTVLEPAIV